MKIPVAVCTIAFVAVSTTARAQYTGPMVYVHGEPHHASTFEEGYLRGLGAMYQGYGLGSLYCAQARNVSQQAWQSQIENHVRRVTARRELQEAYRMAQEARRSKPSPTNVRAAAYVPTVPSEDVGHDGSIRWASVLLEPGTSELRNRIEKELRCRAETGEMTAATCQALLRDCQDVIGSLIDRRRNNSIDNFAFAAGFKCVEGLKREIRISQARPSVRFE